jgi:hypothetical protein
MSVARHIIYMRLSDLTPAEVNPKLHDLPAIEASLVEFGFVAPATLDERTGRLCAGHGRREACINLRARGENPPDGVFVDDDGEWLIPVLRGWASTDDAQALAYIVADNQLTMNAGWHMMTLGNLVHEVVTVNGGLLDAMGLNDEKVEDLLKRVDPDRLNPGELGGDHWEPTPSSRDDLTPHRPKSDLPGEPMRARTQDDGYGHARGEQWTTCPNCSHRFEVTR